MPLRIRPNSTLSFTNDWSYVGAPSFHEAIRSDDGDLSYIQTKFRNVATKITFSLDDVDPALPDYDYQYVDIVVVARVVTPTTQSPFFLGRVLIDAAENDDDLSLWVKFDLTAQWQKFTVRVILNQDQPLTKSRLNALLLRFKTLASPEKSDEIRISYAAIEFFDPKVGRTTALLWQYTSPVTRTSKLRWAIPLTAVGRTFKPRWLVNGAAARRLKIRWKNLTIVGRTRKLLWGIRTAVGATNKLDWINESPAFKVARLRWHIGGIVGRSERLRWNVLTTTDATLIKLRWDIRQIGSKVNKLRWHIKSLVTKRNRLRWFVANPFATGTAVRILDTVCDEQPDEICHPYVTLEVSGNHIYQVSIKNGDQGYADWQDYGDGLFDLTLEPGEGDKTVCVKARNIDLVENPEQCTTITVNVGDQLQQLHDNLPAIYSTAKKGLLYELLSSWALWLCHASKSIDAAIDQGNVNLAVGVWLDQWGFLTGIGRKLLETDADYRRRIYTWLTTDKVTLKGLHTLANTEIGSGEFRLRELTTSPAYLVGDLAGARDYDFARLQDAVDLAKPAGVKVIWRGGDWSIEIIPIDDDISGLGDDASYTVRVRSIGGFFGPVDLSAGELPAGYIAMFSQNPVTVPAGGSVDSLMKIVREVDPVTFEVEVSPSLLHIDGPSGTFQVRAISIGGFAGVVDLSKSPLPAGYTGSFSPSSVTVPAGGYGESTLTIQKV